MKKIIIKIAKFTWADIEQFKKAHPDKPGKKKKLQTK